MLDDVFRLSFAFTIQNAMTRIGTMKQKTTLKNMYDS